MSLNKSDIENKMNKTIETLDSSLATIRTGRANAAILNRVEVEYYGSMTPLNQVAAIQVVEGRQLVIKPYDKGVLKDIERAIAIADLGLNGQNDGDVVRINVPSLTEDRRKALSKDASKMGEEAKIALRNIRRDANEQVKKDAELTEDEKKQNQDDVQTLTDTYVKKIDQTVNDKIKDIMSI